MGNEKGKKKPTNRGAVKGLIRVGASKAIEKSDVASVPEVLELPVPMPGKTAIKIGPKGIRYLNAYLEKGSFIEAYLSVNPRAKRENSYGNASNYHKKIMAAFGGRDAFWEWAGVSYGAIANTVRAGMLAETQREFVIVKTGEIVRGEKTPDHPTRLVSAKLGAQLRGVLKENEGSQPIEVNVINYANPNAPRWGEDPAYNAAHHLSISDELLPTNGEAIDVTPSRAHQVVDADFFNGEPGW